MTPTKFRPAPFRGVCDEMLDIVLPAVGRENLVTVGQLHAGGEFFEALIDLALIAQQERIPVPAALRGRILDELDALTITNRREYVEHSVQVIRAALAAVPAA